MTRDTRINVVNIGLMVVSCIAAFILPFEVFLFSYAVLGPLHYLTEISWLHDRQYFAKGKYDFLILLIIGVLLSFSAAAGDLKIANDFLEWYQKQHIYGRLLTIALFGSLVLAFVKNVLIKVVCLLLVFVFAAGWFMPNTVGEDGSEYLEETKGMFVVTSLIPTLIHVYIFTLLFMLFGALKSRSVSGLWSIAVLIICPLLLIFLFQDNSFFKVSNYGRNAYYSNGDGFWDLNVEVLSRLSKFNYPARDSIFTAESGLQYQTYKQATINNGLLPQVFESKSGILLQRFIAFAYTYHYLNWFSKTEIIRWHQVPKARFIAVLVIYAASLGIYAYNYAIGLSVLFFLSFCHVLLEFPLNWTSLVGIVKELWAIRKNGFKLKSVVEKTN